MSHVIPTLMLVAALPMLAAPAPDRGRAPPSSGILTGRGPADRVIRMPRMPRLRAVPPVRTEWREKKGPDCLAVDQLAGVIGTGRNSIDLMLQGGRRLRARMDADCPGLDFYQTFYLKPSADGQVCAKRDAIRSRSGDNCLISGFRRLEAKR